MHRRISIAPRALVIIAVPLLLVGNMLWVLAQSWLVRILYAAPGIPVPVRGLADGSETAFGLAGVHAIQPLGTGAEPLRAARLPDGTPAFTPREVAHMADVAAVVDAFVIGWAIAVVVIAVSALTARGPHGRAALWRSLTRGAWLTLALIGVVAVGMLLSFDAFFVAFHGVLFEGSSWRFGPDALLLQLYPERFWLLSASLAAVAIIVQALAVVLLSRYAAARPQARRGAMQRPAGTAASHSG